MTAVRPPSSAAAEVSGPTPRRVRPPRWLDLRLVLGVLLVLAAAAWLVTKDRMGAMAPMPATELGDLGFYLTVWVVMMAAMMFPSVAPTVLIYDRLREANRARGKGAAPDATALFVAGYLCVWTAAGLGVYGLFDLVRSFDLAFLGWDEWGRYVTGTVLVAAAVYQMTPLKQACLIKCRSPMMFLAEHWRHGRTGAVELGVRHGAWCLGCCWALMAGLFAVGVMSLGWMTLIAAFIAGEKLLPWPVAARTVVAVLLLALALGLAFAPASVPGFIEPGEGTGGHGAGMQMTR